MKIKLLGIGKNAHSYVDDAEDMYHSRIKRYVPFDIEYATKKFKGDVQSVQKQEADWFEGRIGQSQLVLLDEKGKDLTSKEFATWLQKRLNQGQDMSFLIGGAYGFSPAIREQSKFAIRLSSMTFSHQLARVVFLEQLYRGFTIINGEPYHND